MANYATYRILTEDEEQAGHLKGDIQEETHSDCWGVELVSVHEIDAEEDEKEDESQKDIKS